MNMQEKLDQILGKEISQASNEEIYDALLTIVQEMASKKERTDSKKKLYYISAEFLIGKLLSNNMINLGIYKEVKEILEKHGKNLSEIEEITVTGMPATTSTTRSAIAASPLFTIPIAFM